MGDDDGNKRYTYDVSTKKAVADYLTTRRASSGRASSSGKTMILLIFIGVLLFGGGGFAILKELFNTIPLVVPLGMIIVWVLIR